MEVTSEGQTAEGIFDVIAEDSNPVPLEPVVLFPTARPIFDAETRHEPCTQPYGRIDPRLFAAFAERRYPRSVASWRNFSQSLPSLASRLCVAGSWHSGSFRSIT